MHFKEAMEFLGLPYASVREIAPMLPRHDITLTRFGYLRRELLTHFAGLVRVGKRVERYPKGAHSV
jgi:hypothetical protein